MISFKLKSNWIKWKRGESTKEKFQNLLVREIKQSELELCRISQLESYPQEYDKLSMNDVIPTKSNLISLKPIFKDGLIRVVVVFLMQTFRSTISTK